MHTRFERIDGALEIYFENAGVFNYKNKDGRGQFMQYIIDEELDDIKLPIDDELGDGCEPTDCAYAWIHEKIQFPVPSCIAIPEERMQEYIFYILQYCFKHGQCPPDSR